MSEPLQLVGQVDDRDDRIARLEHENHGLRQDLRAARIDAAQTVRAVTTLRHLLTPLKRGIDAMFGEMDAIGGEDSPAQQANPKWQSWKQRLPGRPAEFIDLLLVHGSMTIKQFMAAAHCGQNSAYQTVSKLGQAGVTINVGGRYSLKDS